ncbi:MAG: hypothetical protein ACREV9_12155 [Burkholderiales bacterium]
MRLTHKQKSDGFHPMWIVWPVLATFLIALLLALPTFYATIESESQHDLATPLLDANVVANSLNPADQPRN